jgi:hypothetical protein
MSPKRLTLLLFLSILGGVILGFWFYGWLAVDRCLDSGGDWNKQYRFCEKYLEPPSRP